ncbi:MAG: phosphoribosylformylglycinamidine synthase subunit PurS, partial [Verrucomicrobia bacterium]|nr:phosphoribosylformylglycinamidine synthase subunit PurS [Verrucomicrobiota bacterium]
MKVHVIVMPKQSVLDPQGVAVRNALKDVGLETVESVRVGKFLELEFKTPP